MIYNISVLEYVWKYVCKQMSKYNIVNDLN